MSCPPWLNSEEFSGLDRHFAEFIHEQAEGAPISVLAAALVSRARRLGHVCLQVDDLPAHLRELGLPENELHRLGGADFASALKASPVVGSPGDFRPLILANQRLYLHRYWAYESELAANLRRLAKAELDEFNPEAAGKILKQFFPEPSQTPWQKVAAFAGLRKQLTILTGGPGTGKTFTLVFLLAALQRLSDRPLRISTCAPTGKAAGRLQESISQLRSKHPELHNLPLPAEASTIHRLLGSRPDSIFFRHDRTNPLATDVVVVDEGSMIDLALFAKLVDALPPHARLILAGDRNQLASVEAGSIFADLLEGVTPNQFGPAFQNDWAQTGGPAIISKLPSSPATSSHVLQDCVIELEKNFRFQEGSGIALASTFLRKGLPLPEDFLQGTGEDLQLLELTSLQHLKSSLRGKILEQFDQLIHSKDPLEAFAGLNRFRILCAVRHGPWGVAGINQLMEEILAEGGRIRRSEPFYSGRPILITQNDYNLKLFNGDVGLVLPDPAEKSVSVYFPDPEGGWRKLSPARLPSHETVHAMTIHKSQGSEWDEIAIILPREGSPVLTRELIYTALTRARKRVQLFSSRPVLAEAWSRPTRRHSGLPEALLVPGAPTERTTR